MFSWNESSENAAKLLSEGRLSIDSIANKCGVSEKTIDRWKKNPEFQSRIQKYLDEILANGTAKRENRIRAKRRRIGQIREFLKKRANNPELGGVKGDPSGLFIRREKSLNIGDGVYQIVEEISLDRAVASELRALEDSIAMEKGEYKRHFEISKPPEEASEAARQLAEVLTPNQIEQLIEFLEGKRATPPTDEPDGTTEDGDAGGPETGARTPPEQ